jgi:hypothetical protein
MLRFIFNNEFHTPSRHSLFLCLLYLLKFVDDTFYRIFQFYGAVDVATLI